MTADLADISNRDREPIHIPGSIQPHGAMLARKCRNLAIVHVAGHISRFFGDRTMLGLPLTACIGATLGVRAGATTGTEPTFVGTMEAPLLSLDIIVHVSGKFLIVELEPRYEPAKSSAELLGLLGRATGILDRTSNLQSLCERSAIEFRNLTQYDRVMVYRFLEDGSGAVVAEDRRPGLHSFLNHRFPASDIPQQARALYVLNRIRVIPDASYAPAGLQPAWRSPEPLDMSNCALRSVSPIHVQYLKNMHVAASASISIVIDGALWAHCLPQRDAENNSLRRSRDLSNAQQYAGSSHRNPRGRRNLPRAVETARRGRSSRRRRLSEGGLLEEGITQQLGHLAALLPASGFVLLRREKTFTSGICPAEPDIRQFVEWLSAGPARTVFSTDELTAHYPAAENFGNIAAGVMSVALSLEERWFLIWFRAEEIQVVNWAGNPHKAIDLKPGETLNPRASFEEWREIVHGRSRRWTPEETEIVEKLRQDLTNVWQTQRLRELNQRLVQSLAEKDQLLEQKQFLIGEVNHRAQNSLQLISNYLSRQARKSADATYAGTITEALRRIGAVSLLHRRLYRGEDVSVTDAGGYISELCDTLIVSLGPEWRNHFVLRLDPVMLPIDSAIPLGLLAIELIINVSKYAYDGQAGPIDVTLSDDRLGFRFSVADNGHGRKSDAPGIRHPDDKGAGRAAFR